MVPSELTWFQIFKGSEFASSFKQSWTTWCQISEVGGVEAPKMFMSLKSHPLTSGGPSKTPRPAAHLSEVDAAPLQTGGPEEGGDKDTWS